MPLPDYVPFHKTKIDHGKYIERTASGAQVTGGAKSITVDLEEIDRLIAALQTHQNELETVLKAFSNTAYNSGHLFRDGIMSQSEWAYKRPALRKSRDQVWRAMNDVLPNISTCIEQIVRLRKGLTKQRAVYDEADHQVWPGADAPSIVQSILDGLEGLFLINRANFALYLATILAGVPISEEMRNCFGNTLKPAEYLKMVQANIYRFLGDILFGFPLDAHQISSLIAAIISKVTDADDWKGLSVTKQGSLSYRPQHLSGLLEMGKYVQPTEDDPSRHGVTVSKVTLPNGEIAWVLVHPPTSTRPKTDNMGFDKDNPLDWFSNFQQASSSDPMAAVNQGVAATLGSIEALRQAGFKKGDKLFIAGHSQGGLDGAIIGSVLLQTGQTDSVTLLTAGSPIGLVDMPKGMEALSVENTGDVVPIVGSRRSPEGETIWNYRYDETTGQAKQCTLGKRLANTLHDGAIVGTLENAKDATDKMMADFANAHSHQAYVKTFDQLEADYPTKIRHFMDNWSEILSPIAKWETTTFNISRTQ
jgi:hypothetical protein